MARLRKERVRARLSHTPFDYPIRPYRMSLADYFVRGSETRPRLEEIDSVVHTDRETELQHLFHQLQLSDGAPDTSFPVRLLHVIDGVVPHDEYRDEMDMMTVSQIAGIVQLQPVSAFDMFGMREFHLLHGDVRDCDFGTEDQPRELKIGSPLSTNERDRLIHLLRSYLDVFAWSYEDMPGLDPSIVQHHLPTLPHARPVKQKLRRLHPRWSLQVKEEIQKQLSVGFISVVEYPEWLANVVPVPKKDGKVRGYNQIFDGSRGYGEDNLITEWGTYCYRVMPFGLKNAGATYQRAATTLFHDMMHRDVEVYVDDMIVKSRGRADHLDALERFFERIRKFRLRLNPKKCTFGVTSGKLLGHIVSERGIEVDPDKIKAILDMPAPKTEKEIRGFLGRLQYISRFIARLTDICEPIFRLLRKNQPTVWNDDCQFAFENIKEYLLSPPVLVPLTPGRPLLLYLSSFRHGLGITSLGYQEIEALHDRVLKFDIQYVSQKSIKGSIVADHLASLPTSEDRPVDDDFPDEEFVAMTSLSGWCMYFDGAANQSGYGIGVLLVSPQGRSHSEMEVFGDSNLVLRQIQGDWKTRDVKLRPYHAYLELLVARFDDLRYVHLPRAQNRFADALATLASSVNIPIDIEDQDDLPWYHDIHQFLRFGTYPEIEPLQIGVMREVHSGVCGPHMGGHMLARKIMRTGYFWLTMETDCCQFVQKCPECQIHGDLIHAPPSELHALTSPWPFSVWGIDIIGKVSPKSSSGHEFILVAIDYFTSGWKPHSYARLTSARHFVAGVMASDIIDLQHIGHRPMAAVEAANKNIKRILRKMVETSRDWSEKLPLHCGRLSEKDGSCFKKRVKPRPLQKGDLVLRILRGLIGDPRGKFRPSWSGPYVIRELTPEGAAWLTDLDGNQFSEPTNVDQLKKYYV
ncbi:Retrovirus-related Pol polyprotein from transposon 17.6 [Vitis vinifera]|uniref:Retrovirus-related Pol polyprotein from transposon 17.6 n=1 Tax=Vitis vinifera TaxID=29760 RepID=A0A438C7M5_VITVI|nr:Retrovirus-related Pol polyprotein from transposon 17.6 [Vitis vinifera]